MRTRWSFLVLPALFALLFAQPVAGASAATADPWPQFQGGEARLGSAAAAPAPPYRSSWQAAVDIGDATHWAGVPVPVIGGGLAFVEGRETIAAVDVADGTSAWTAPRALGPSSAPAVVAGTVFFLEGGGDESSSAPSSSSPAATASSSTASASASAAPPEAADPNDSVLVALDIESQKRVWTAALTDVSHTGVLAVGGSVIVGTDDGQITAFDAERGSQRWSIRAGDHALAPMAASGDVVLASVRPEAREAPTLLALHVADGTEAWRYQPSGSVLDLGAPSVQADTVYLVASDASVRALSLADGTQRWATTIYSPSAGSPPVVRDGAVYVTDQSGTIYAFDEATGTERWRFATNRFAVASPIATSSAVLQPANDGSVVAVDVASGHQTWSATVADGVVFGLAASDAVIVAAHTGSTPGLTGLVSDPSGAIEDLASPTSADPANLFLAWLLAMVPIVAALIWLGRTLDRRMGPADLGAVPEDVVDPWEADLEGDEP